MVINFVFFLFSILYPFLQTLVHSRLILLVTQEQHTINFHFVGFLLEGVLDDQIGFVAEIEMILILGCFGYCYGLFAILFVGLESALMMLMGFSFGFFVGLANECFLIERLMIIHVDFLMNEDAPNKYLIKKKYILTDDFS